MRKTLRGEVRLRPAAGALADRAGQAVDRRFGGDEREQWVKQRQIDDLALPALGLDLAQCHEHRHGTVEPGDHVGQRRRRQSRLAIGEAGARSIARHALDQGAKAGAVAIGAILPPAGNPDDDQAGVVFVQDFRTEAHCFERPGTKILDQHLCGGGEAEQQRAHAPRAGSRPRSSCCANKPSNGR